MSLISLFWCGGEEEEEDDSVGMSLATEATRLSENLVTIKNCCAYSSGQNLFYEIRNPEQ